MRFVAGLASMVAGLGFGLPCAWGIAHLARTGDTWTFLGFQTYGGGPFERAGIGTTVPLLVAFLVVCMLEVVLAVMIWTPPSGRADTRRGDVADRARLLDRVLAPGRASPRRREDDHAGARGRVIECEVAVTDAGAASDACRSRRWQW